MPLRHFPSNLKNAYTSPIFKSGSSADIKNYRPIVILSTLAKSFEALVLNKLMFNLKRVINTEKDSFVKGCSTASNLLWFQNHILSAFSNSHQVDAIYTDFSKAIVRVKSQKLDC